MDMVNFRNFNVHVYDIVDSNTYQLTYILAEPLEYYQGSIFIHVSTFGQPYTQYGGNLQFEVQRFGSITHQNELTYLPPLGNSVYTAHYKYTIHDGLIYTNLLDVYPYVSIFGVTLGDPSPAVIMSSDAITPGPPLAGGYWRGQSVTVSWNVWNPMNYANAHVNIDIYTSNSLYTTWGPIPLRSDSGFQSMSIQIPYLSTPITSYIGAFTSPNVPTSIRCYIAGQPAEATVFNVTTAIPCFTILSLTNVGTTNYLMGGYGIQGITSQGQSLDTTSAVVTYSNPYGYASFNNDTQYGVNNLFFGGNFIGPVDISRGADSNVNVLIRTIGFPSSGSNYYYPMHTLVFTNVDATSPVGSNVEGNTITGYTYDGQTYFGYTVTLGALDYGASQTFSF